MGKKRKKDSGISKMKQLPLVYKIANTLRNFSIGLLHKGLHMLSSKCDRIVSSGRGLSFQPPIN
jgi:hypothetical protein